MIIAVPIILDQAKLRFSGHCAIESHKLESYLGDAAWNSKGTSRFPPQHLFDERTYEGKILSILKSWQPFTANHWKRAVDCARSRPSSLSLLRLWQTERPHEPNLSQGRSDHRRRTCRQFRSPRPSTHGLFRRSPRQGLLRRAGERRNSGVAETVGRQVGLQAAEPGRSQLAGSDAVCRRALGKSTEIDVIVRISLGVADFGQYCQRNEHQPSDRCDLPAAPGIIVHPCRESCYCVPRSDANA